MNEADRDRLAVHHAINAMAAITVKLDAINRQVEYLTAALGSIHRRLQLHEASLALYEIHTDRGAPN